LANHIDNRLIVVGLQENSKEFAEALEMEMYGHVVPRETGNFFVEVVNGYFDFTTKWAPKVDAVIELSKKRNDHVFLLSYGGFETQRNGQVVIRNGNVLDSFDRPGYSGLFDEIEHPTLDLFFPYLGKRTLAERAANRLQDAVGIVRGLIEILNDGRFKQSPSTPYSDVRNQKQTEKVRARLGTLLDSMVSQVAQLDFGGVLVEEAELRELMVLNVKSAGELVTTLGLDCLVPEPGLVARFAILPFTTAISQDPSLVILPILDYINADVISGRYQKNPDGSIPAIEWRVRHVCVRPTELRQISRLPDEDRTPCDIDIIMKDAGDRAFGYELYRASNKARWKLNPTLAKQVEQKAIEMSRAFAARVAGKPGIAILDNFAAADAMLFPKTIK
jgi:hypothetical protein